MKNALVASLLAAVLGIFIGALLPRADAQSWPQPPHIIHWQQECLVVETNDPRALNQLMLNRGNAGWELVAMTSTVADSRIYTCFKRRGP